MARAKSARRVDDKVYSFKLNKLSKNKAERELREYIDTERKEAESKNDDWSLRPLMIEMWKAYRGYPRPKTDEVASAIVEATEGLWRVFNDILQNRPTNRDAYHEIAENNGIEFTEEFIDGMLGVFGRADE